MHRGMLRRRLGARPERHRLVEPTMEERVARFHTLHDSWPTYAWGSNGAGQLGLQHRDDISSPELYLGLSLRWPHRIIGSGNHTIILSRDANDYGQPMMDIVGDEGLANAPDVTTGTTTGPRGIDAEWWPDQIHHFRRSGATAAAATWDAFACITDDFESEGHSNCAIVSFGASEKGQLGRPEEMSPEPSMDNGSVVAMVPLVRCMAGGVQHFVVVLDNGDVVGWGNGRKGQLGEPAEAAVGKPRVIPGINFRVAWAACGREFTILLSEPAEGRILILGSDKFGIKSNAPKEVKNWKEAGAGWGSATILLADGTLISWGRNDHGQLAPNGLPLIEKIAVGSEHTVALSRDGQVLVWGWGEHGNCGKDVDENGDVKGRFNVMSLPEDKIKECRRRVEGVGAGCATSWFWLSRPGPSAEEIQEEQRQNELRQQLRDRQRAQQAARAAASTASS